LLVAAENFRAFGCDLWHVAVPRRGGPRDAIDELWEVEWLLNLPDFLMSIRREKPGGIAFGNPPNRNGCAGGQCRPQVDVRHSPAPRNYRGALRREKYLRQWRQTRTLPGRTPPEGYVPVGRPFVPLQRVIPRLKTSNGHPGRSELNLSSACSGLVLAPRLPKDDPDAGMYAEVPWWFRNSPSVERHIGGIERQVTAGASVS